MNIISIAGKLGRDAEVKYLPDGTAVANFTVADDQGRSKPAIWWRCQLFGKRAESLAQYLVKGASVTVGGSVSEREYEKDGAKVKAQDVRVSEVALQGSKPVDAAKQQGYQGGTGMPDDSISDCPF